MKKATIALLLVCVAVFAQQKGAFTDSRDKKTYKTVRIGEQTWMAENLNYKSGKCYGEGGKLIAAPRGKAPNAPKKTLSDDEIQVNCEKYGRLYDWNVAMKSCPSGWHLPSDKEWQELVNFAGGDEVAGKKLKAEIGWDSNGNGTDEFGFLALPGGKGFESGGFANAGTHSNWWNSTEYGSYGGAYYRAIGYYENDVFRDYLNKSNLFSVRCVRDEVHSGKVSGGKLTDSQNGTVNEVSDEMFSDSRDGKKYKTVKIGKQTWMAENLNYEASGSVCYENNPAYCSKYGRLYDWNTALKSCPSGWHLPSKSEYEELDKAVGGEKVAGKKLKAKSGWSGWDKEDGNGTDEFGFSALPGGNGYPYPQGGFGNIGSFSYWWGANEGNKFLAYGREIDYHDDSANGGNYDKSGLHSVRCLQDKK